MMGIDYKTCVVVSAKATTNLAGSYTFFLYNPMDAGSHAKLWTTYRSLRLKIIEMYARLYPLKFSIRLPKKSLMDFFEPKNFEDKARNLNQIIM